MIDDTHAPALRSWVESANVDEADFPIQNLPFGVFRPKGRVDFARIGVAIGDQILDLPRCRDAGLFDDLPERIAVAVGASTLNDLMALGPSEHSELRRKLSAVLARGRVHFGASDDPFDLLVPFDEAQLLVPAAIGDYTDFYASMFHATNVGRLFRPDNPLLPNYKHLPIAYHGRASSIVIDGTTIARPSGQITRSGVVAPVFAPSERLDYEVELGVFIGSGNAMGNRIPVDRAEEHLFGLCLMNDWSARDIQAWEYQPLGPFLGKNFATSISPWVVTLDALAPFRCPAAVRPPEDPHTLPYLSSGRDQATGGFDVTVDVFLRSAAMRAAHLDAWRLSRSSARALYWTFAQMIAHHTSNGCNLRPGDLLGSGTLSGPTDEERGCLLEITSQGSRPLTLPTGETRAFLADGDEVILRAFCERPGCVRIGFGECRGTIAGQAAGT